MRLVFNRIRTIVSPTRRAIRSDGGVNGASDISVSGDFESRGRWQVSQGVKSISSSLPTLSHTRIAIVLVVWTLLTLPLVTLGPGSDVDAWTVARTGERIWDSGTYIRSRTSGFPLYELALAPL